MSQAQVDVALKLWHILQTFLILAEEIQAARSPSRQRAELGLDFNVLMPNVPSTMPQLPSEHLPVQDEGYKSAEALRLMIFKYLTIWKI